MTRRTVLNLEPLETRALLSGTSVSITTDQSTYQVGQPVQITVTDTNTTDQTIMYPVSGYTDRFNIDIEQDGVEVWALGDGGGMIPQFIGEGSLQPGQSLTYVETWNGISNEGLQTVMSGSFTVNASFYLPGYVSNGQALSTTFQIAAPPAGQLTTSLTTDQSTYAFGQPIQMTLTETNTGDQPTSIIGGTNFDVTQDGLPIWASANSPDLTGSTYLPFWHNDPDPYWMTLQPGQTSTQTVAWYGTAQDSSTGVTGTFVVSNEAAPQLNATIQIGDPLSYSITTDQSSYPFGQPVQITFTGTNTTDQPATVVIDPSDFIVTQAAGLDLDWESNPVDTGQPTTVTLQPGQSYTQTATWDGIPQAGTDDSSYSPVTSWGLFYAINKAGAPWTDATFQIANPIAYSVTTDQSTYQVGEPVQITFVQTNTGDQPATFGAYSVDFQVECEDVNWDSWFGAGEPTPVVTLQPGQSYTQTVTWDGIGRGDSAGATGSFVTMVTGSSAELFNPIPSATFQIVAPPSQPPPPVATPDPAPSPVATPDPTPPPDHATPSPAATATPTPSPTATLTPTPTSVATPTPTPPRSLHDDDRPGSAAGCSGNHRPGKPDD